MLRRFVDFLDEIQEEIETEDTPININKIYPR